MPEDTHLGPGDPHCRQQPRGVRGRCGCAARTEGAGRKALGPACGSRAALRGRTQAHGHERHFPITKAGGWKESCRDTAPLPVRAGFPTGAESAEGRVGGSGSAAATVPPPGGTRHRVPDTAPQDPSAGLAPRDQIGSGSPRNSRTESAVNALLSLETGSRSAFRPGSNLPPYNSFKANPKRRDVGEAEEPEPLHKAGAKVQLSQQPVPSGGSVQGQGLGTLCKI